MNTKELSEYLAKNCYCKDSAIRTDEIPIRGMTILRLRDTILVNGWRILLEDLERQVYITSIKGGFLRMNKADVALHLCDKQLRIALYAREGILNQHTSEDVLNEIQRVFHKD